MSAPSPFTEFGQEPCAVCGRNGRCKNSMEQPGNLVLCFRCTDDQINGFRRVKTTNECSTYVRIGSEADRNGTPRPSPAGATGNLNSAAEQYARAVTPGQLARLATELGVSPESLRAIDVGFDGECPCFPERDPGGTVTAINYRQPDGRKLVGKGHRRGLIIPTGLANLPDPVLAVEGPTDVAACLTMGLTAVGRANNSGGAEYLAELLPSREVILVGENDRKLDGTWPGRDGAAKIAGQLATAWNRPVRYALPPTHAKDVREYFRANWHRDPAEVGRELLAHLQVNAVAAEPCVSSGSGPGGGFAESWPEPQPLLSELPAVAPFRYELLPQAFRGWVQDVVERSQCPPDFPGVAAMVALSAVVGRKVGVRPKRRDDWTVVPNLWGAVIGRSGLLKTPMLEETTRPVKRIEIEAKKRYEAEVRQHAVRLMVAEERKKASAALIRKALKDGGDAESAAAAAISAGGNVVAPVRRRILANDCTVEKLGEILNQNPNGILVNRDELIGLLRSLEKEGYESARAFYLEAWNGTGRFTFDRIGRGTIDIESTTVSILGGIQPSVLQQYLRSTLREIGDDGFIQRFQLAVWPDVSKEWENVDRWPNTEAKNLAYAVFQRLDVLATATIGAKSDDNADGLPFLRFDDDAQRLFDDWHWRLEHRLRSDELHPILESHLAKYRSLIPSLALLIHLTDDGVGPIGIDPLRRAIAWGKYLETHAERIYHGAVNPDAAAARALASRMLKGNLKDGFAARDVYRHGWTGLTDSEDVERATKFLCDLDWLRATREATGGAPKTLFWINPKIHRTPGKPTDKTDKRGKNGLLSVTSVPSGGDPGDLRPNRPAVSEKAEEPVEDDSDRREREAIMDVEAEAEADALHDEMGRADDSELSV